MSFRLGCTPTASRHISLLWRRKRQSYFVCLPALFACTAMTTLPAMAEPPVLFDNGTAISLNRDEATPPALVPRSQRKHHALTTPKQSSSGSTHPTSPLVSLPFKNHTLAVGQFKRHRADFPTLKTPLCIIGSDDRSLSWLLTYHDQLIQLGARCLLIEARNRKAMERVAGYAGAIPVLPDVTGRLVERFSLTHYPALISRHWIEQ